jgi:anti-sigma factor (TIGR02949 family)
MNCGEARSFVHGYVDGELDLVRSVEIERHVAECPSCARELESLQALRATIRNRALVHRAPPGLERRIRSRIRPRVTSPRWKWLAAAASLALVAAVAWGVRSAIGPSRDERLATEIASSHVRSLLASHLTDVPSSDHHTVKPWFAGKIDFSPPVPELADHGFPLAGGRLDVVDEQPVAVLVYRRREHVINCFVWPTTRGPEAPRESSRRGYHEVHWIAAGMEAWAVSDLNGEELMEFARLASAAMR